MAHSARPLLSVSFFLVAALAAPAAQAGGFYVPEVGARSVAMANAQVAQSEDTTALFHNVAGIAGLGGTQVQISGLGVLADINYFRRPVDLNGDPSDGREHNFAPVQNTNGLGIVPAMGVTTDFGVKNLGVGIGLSVPFGAHIKYPQTGAQRYVVTEVDFKTIYVTPSVAYKIADRLSLGVGLSYVYGAIKINQASNFNHLLGNPDQFPDPDTDPSQGEGMNYLSAKDKASFGANLGWLYTDPDNRFGFGMSMMIPTTLKFEGDALLENEAILQIDDENGDPYLPAGKREDKFTLDYPLPMILRAGMMVRPHPQVMVALDVNWQRWETFDTLTIDFKNNYPLQNMPNTVAYDMVIQQNWENSFSIRGGIDGRPVKSVPLFLRAGVLYDGSPIRDAYFDLLAPESDKVGVSGGLGYQVDIRGKARVDIDVAYMHLFLADRDIKPIKVGPDENAGNDDNGAPVDDTVPNGGQGENPGSNKTILNKPAANHYYGVTKVAFNLLGLSIALRL